VRTERLQKEYGVELRWTVFPLHPETPEEGIELSQLFAGREKDIEIMQRRLLQLAESEGLRLTERSRTYNSRRAQELGKWAELQGKGVPYRKAVYEAYFVEGRNIALVDELVRIAEAAGLPGDDARATILNESFRAAVDADWRRALELGITAVPTHLSGGKRVEGFRPYNDFLRLIGKG
jgi:predicted DsbA family dithiol-disulfide isomerase